MSQFPLVTVAEQIAEQERRGHQRGVPITVQPVILSERRVEQKQPSRPELPPARERKQNEMRPMEVARGIVTEVPKRPV